jgi:hypothetical protein
MNHGVFIKGVPPEHEYECWWMGERVCIADFNTRLMDATREISTYAMGLREGMDLTAAINEGQKTVAQLEAIEEIARLPLCSECRKLIGTIEE